MSQICCTAKLLKELGIPVSSCPEPQEPGNPFELWYAMLVFWGGKKCVLFFNPASTLTAVALYVKRAQIRDMENLAGNAIGFAIDQLDVSQSVKNRIKASIRGVGVRKTNDRAALACMNQIRIQLKYRLAFGVVFTRPLTERNLAWWLNAANLVRYDFPSRALAKVLAELGWE